MEKETLIKGLSELGVEPSDAIVSKFSTYLIELKKWNRAYNLTALKKDEDIIIKHFLDSLLYLKVIPEGRWNICDIGSGAGFPGIPIAIVRPQFNVALIEPTRKKTAFLRHMKRTLCLDNVEVLESRIEEVQGRLFDIALTRALFSVSDFIKNAQHVLNEQGFFVLSKGPKLEDELKHLPRNVTCEIVKVVLPEISLERSIIKAKIILNQA